MRLDKWIANAGLGTRTEVKKALRAGRVFVNGSLARDPGMHVTPGKDSVEWDGEPVLYEEYRHFMMYKPAGYLSATEDLRDPVVIDLLDDSDANFEVFPVGRLDKDAEGLLLLTNDGRLAHQLLSPKKHVPKLYLIHVDGRLTKEDVKRIAEGVVLEDGYEAMPGDLEILEAGPTSVAQITIYEGKFHQVKRMLAVLGKPVLFLKRLRMGPLELDEALKPGEYRPLYSQELQLLYSIGERQPD